MNDVQLCATCFFFNVLAPTRSVSWRVVQEAEAEHQQDDGSPGDFTQQLQAADSFLLHGSESQHHRGPDDEDEPGENSSGRKYCNLQKTFTFVY